MIQINLILVFFLIIFSVSALSFLFYLIYKQADKLDEKYKLNDEVKKKNNNVNQKQLINKPPHLYFIKK